MIKQLSIKGIKNTCRYIVHIKETSNNTILTLTDLFGNCLLWQSNGSSKFKGLRKSTSVANNTTGVLLGGRIKALGIKTVNLHFNGWGKHRKETVKGLLQNGLFVKSIKENTALPHNGCRLKKKKRIRRRRFKTYWF
mgnify:CR=1 FL=1